MKKKKTVLDFINNKGEMIFSKKTSELELKETFVVNTSLERYGTDEPCIIYRTCIANDVLSDLDSYILKCKKENKSEILIEELPQEIQNAVVFNSDVRKIKWTNG